MANIWRLTNIDTVIFDKTGTLTKGKPEVTDVISNNDNNNAYTQYEILQIASYVENKSQHPIAQAIITKASEQLIPTFEVSQFNSISGHGIMAFYREKRIFVGSPTTIIINNGSSFIPQRLQLKISKLEAEGKTVVAVFIEYKLIVLIAVPPLYPPSHFCVFTRRRGFRIINSLMACQYLSIMYIGFYFFHWNAKQK